jgi:hypothetical protein
LLAPVAAFSAVLSKERKGGLRQAQPERLGVRLELILLLRSP